MSRRPWWWDAVFYQVYIRSFMDAGGDGVGDLPGITQRLPYLADLGVDAVWITPFYPSPMVDHGYDVADYRGVDPLFGGMRDFDELLAEAHRLKLRVIIDIVPNHTSDKHAWFQEAIRDPESPMRGRFIFRDPRPGGEPPNNWTSVFGGPAWSREPHGRQYYLHLFAPEQPDLNWRNPDVQQEFRSILRFWLDRGVDGFRIDVAHGLYKDADLRDNPTRDDGILDGTAYRALESKYNWDQDDVLEVYEDWRRLIDAYPGDRMMVGEVFLFDQERVARYVGPTRLHQTFNFAFAGTRFRADHLQWAASESLRLMNAAKSPPTWVLSNHDLPRHASRFGGGAAGRARGRAVTLMLMALPGSPYLYQGEEIGAEQVDVAPAARQDPIFAGSEGQVAGRDGCRTPIPWDGAPPGFGFTTAEAAWLPFAPDATRRNVAAELRSGRSQLNWYRDVLRLRREVFEGADLGVEWAPPSRSLLRFRRATAGGPVTCVLNSAHRAVDVPVDAGAVLVASKDSVSFGGGILRLPADSCAWLR